MKTLKTALLLVFATLYLLLGQTGAAQSTDTPTPRLIQQQSERLSHRLQRKQFTEEFAATADSSPIKLPLQSPNAQQRVAIGNLDPSFAANVTEGASTVYSLATQPNGGFFVGGNFRYVNGERRGNFEHFNSDGTRDTNFNTGGAGANGSVYVINILPTGKILISGAFTTYNNQPALSLARLNSDGSLDTTFTVQGTSVSGSIQDTIVQPDGKILISGNFTRFDGVIRNYVARLNADGTLDTAFDPNVNGFTEELVLQPDGKIIIGGSFSMVGNSPLGGIARLNADGSVDPSFNPGSGVGGGDFSVYAAERQTDGKILIGGNFTDYNGTPRQNVARLNVDGSLDTSFNPNVGGQGAEFFAIQPDGKILVAGDFTDLNFGLIRLNTDGSFDSSFVYGTVNDFGYVVALRPDGSILLGGLFSEYSNVEHRNFVRLNSNGTPFSTDPSFSTDPVVRAIATQPDGKIIVGGQFRRVNGVLVDNLARLNADGSLDTTFAMSSGVAGFNLPQVYSITVQPDGKILIGGSFEIVNGISRNKVARLNPDGSLDQSFLYNDAVGIVRNIKVQPDGKIILAGFFDDNFGVVFGGVVRLNSDGTYDQTFLGNGANGTVIETELLPDGKILIGGVFTSYNQIQRNRIARLNSDGSLDATFNPGSGANGSVYDIVPLANGQMYVGGFFTSFNGLPNTNDIVRLNPDGSVDTTFSSGASGFSGGIYALSLESDGKILAGGNFNGYNGVAVNQLALLNADGTLDNGFISPLDNNPSNFVYRLVKQSDGKTLVGGFFKVPRNALFRLNAVNSPRQTLFDFDGDGRADISIFRPSDGVWYVQRSSAAGFSAVQWGASGDKLAPADYDGDGKTDLAIFRNGVWYILNSSNSTVTTVQFGISEDLPRPADFDGDGKADINVFRPSDGAWYRLNSTDNQFVAVSFGTFGDIPQPADFDGDGRADINVFRPSNGAWYRLNSTNNQFVSIAFGVLNDIPTTADYDGDGRADISVFRPSTGAWYRLNSSDGQFAAFQFGTNGDVPAPADFDGDGKADFAVFRNGIWYLQQSTAGFTAIPFGTNGDAAVPASFVQ